MQIVALFISVANRLTFFSAEPCRRWRLSRHERKAGGVPELFRFVHFYRRPSRHRSLCKMYKNIIMKK